MIDKDETSGALHRETPTIPRPTLISPMNSPPPTPIAEGISMAQRMLTVQRMQSPIGMQSPNGLYGPKSSYGTMGCHGPKRSYSPMGSHGSKGLKSPLNDRYGSAKLYAQYLREEKMGPEQVRIDSARGSDSLHEDDETELGALDF